MAEPSNRRSIDKAKGVFGSTFQLRDMVKLMALHNT